jgi:Ca2+-binding RTX toxin-like protein
VVERSGEGTDRILAGVSFTLAETYVETLQLTGAGAIDAAGNSQANTLLGNGAANTLTGLGGSDVLDGGGGADRMVGGTGDDVYQVDNALDVVVEAAGEGTDTVFASAAFSLVGSDVEVLRLAGLAAINATGNDLANTLVGNDAANVLTGLGGHDMLDGGKGADTMIGGDGDDTFFVDNSADRTTEVSGGGTDIVYSSASFNLAGVSVETLALTGSAAINGTGNSAANTLIGNAGANTLSGLGSADTLDGGLGADKLIGGTGGDVFRFSAFASDADADQVTDFLSGTDQIALVSAAFNEMRLGPLAVSAFVAGTAALDAADRLIYEAASGKLWFDSDGTGEDAAVLIALLAPGTALVAADIVVI